MLHQKSLYLSPAPRRLSFFAPIGILFGIAFIAAWLVALFGNGFSNPFTELYLLPWIAFAGVVVLAPPVYLAIRKRFDVFHPLVFAAWSYFFPAFVLGGLILASGWSQPYYLAFIPDLEYYLPLTLVYVALGFAGLTLGFVLPFGKRVGDALSLRLPVWDWKPNEILFPGVLLLGVGIFFSTSAFTAGITGYQRGSLLDTFDATLTFFTYFVPVSSFILWYAIFSTEHRTLHFKLVAGLLIVLIPYQTLLSGSRGGLIHNMLPIAMAFWLSGRRIKLHHGIILGFVLTGAVLLGIIYGTTFRLVKGTEEQVDFNSYLDSSSKALQIMGDRGIKDNMVFALDTLSQRMETTSSLAVVVANYEQLEDYAGDYGLAGNIWTYTWTAFIPRFVWPDKPIISDGRAYSALYFDFGDNSFAITPIGDLLRNFGPIGVPVGMAILGFVLRILYSSLVEGQIKSVWRSSAYYLILIKISYEGFYGTILPDLIRMAVIVLLAGFVINLMVRRRSFV
jgi:hypothetical protein